jgi:hypothetical protein
VLIYFGSTLFYSTEKVRRIFSRAIAAVRCTNGLVVAKVFEESTFHRYTIDIFYMFFWTLVTQVATAGPYCHSALSYFLCPIESGCSI